MLILRAKIALNAVISMILFIFSLIMESWLLRKVGFYRSFYSFINNNNNNNNNDNNNNNNDNDNNNK